MMEGIQKGLDIFLSCLTKNDLNIVGLLVTSDMFIVKVSGHRVTIVKLPFEIWNFTVKILQKLSCS